MTDDVESLVDSALGDVSWPLEPMDHVGATADVEPRPADARERPTFARFPLDQFHARKALWAANFFVLWPIGLALTITYETVPVEAAKFCGDADKKHDAHEYLKPMKDGPRPRQCMGTTRGEVVDLHVRQWEYAGGELAETIDQEPTENRDDYEKFLGFVRERLLGMKVDERHLLLRRYDERNVASAATILVAP